MQALQAYQAGLSRRLLAAKTWSSTPDDATALECTFHGSILRCESIDSPFTYDLGRLEVVTYAFVDLPDSPNLLKTLYRAPLRQGYFVL